MERCRILKEKNLDSYAEMAEFKGTRQEKHENILVEMISSENILGISLMIIICISIKIPLTYPI